MTRHTAPINTDMWLPDLCIQPPRPGRSVLVVVEAAAAGPGGAPSPRSLTTLLAPPTPHYTHYTLYTLYTIHTGVTRGQDQGSVTIIAGDTEGSGDTVTQ